MRAIYKERQAEQDRKELEVWRALQREKEIEEYAKMPNRWKKEMESVDKIISLCRSCQSSEAPLTELKTLRQSLIMALKGLKLPELIFACDDENKPESQTTEEKSTTEPKTTEDKSPSEPKKDVELLPGQFSTIPYVNYIKKSEFEVQTQQRLLLEHLNPSSFPPVPQEFSDNLNGVMYMVKRKLWTALGIKSGSTITRTWVTARTPTTAATTGSSSSSHVVNSTPTVERHSANLRSNVSEVSPLGGLIRSEELSKSVVRKRPMTTVELDPKRICSEGKKP